MKPSQDHSVQLTKQAVKEIKLLSSAEPIHSEGDSETHKVPKIVQPKDDESLKEAPLPIMIPALSNDEGLFILKVSVQRTEPLTHDEKDIRKPEHISSIGENMEMTKKQFKAIKQTEREISYLNKRHIQGEKSLHSGDVISPSYETSELPKSLLKYRDDVKEDDSTEPLKNFETSKADSEDATFLKTEQFPCSEKLTQDYEERSLDKVKPTSKMDLIQQHEFTLPVATNLRGIRDVWSCVFIVSRTLITTLAHI